MNVQTIAACELTRADTIISEGKQFTVYDIRRDTTSMVVVVNETRSNGKNHFYFNTYSDVNILV